MKLTFKEKAKLFWDRNGEMVITLLAMCGVVGAIGGGLGYIWHKQEQKAKEEAERLEALLVPSQKEADEREAEIMKDPANGLTGGGYVDPDNDNLYEADCPNILANCVPLSSMGQLGQDIIDRYKQQWPDWEEVGMFNVETAVADVYVDFCHEKWLEAQRAKEAESQEKQAS